VRVAIIDESLVARRVLTRILEDDGRFCVTASYAGADEAINSIGSALPEIILLDVEMPGRSGIDGLPELLEASNSATVVILSGRQDDSGRMGVEALERGARDIIAKPAASHFNAAFAGALIDRLIALHTQGDGACWAAPTVQQVQIALSMPSAPRAIAIGASTGGIHSLIAFLETIGPRPPAPIFITQHLPADFLPFLCDQIARRVDLPVLLASDGMEVAPGHIYLAPGEAHLTVRRSVRRSIEIQLSRAASRHGTFPAVDPMFTSLADIYGASLCGVVLSGMGRDGLIGAESIVRAGGSVLAQDQKSSVVWGMPGAVANAGLASAICPPEQAATIIAQSWLVRG
jgi:two-component system chemotaxis response regulator CheB